MAVIELRNANLLYPIRENSGLTLKEFVLRKLLRRTSIAVKKNVHALKDISLTVQDGDRLGIIGYNGAGKSTLLRTIAGVYPLDSGETHVEGKICSLFDISLGFEDDASGWENIYFRGYLQGETPQTIEPRIQEIADFTGLGEFLDLPIRCYSSGMKMRLAFAIATSSEPEILLIDEVFATGDLVFQEKAKKRMQEFIDRAKIVIMVGHELKFLREFCNRVVWIDQGRICEDGPVESTIDHYENYANPANKAA